MSKKNFTISTVATAPSPATTGTSLVVATGKGSLFAINEPAIIFPANDQPLTSNAEIVKVSNVVGDTLTIVRGQESTTARSIVAGDIIIQGITAKDWNDLVASKFTWRGAWATTTAYAVNDTVQQGGSGYVCVTAHTSGTFATDLSAGKWEMFVEGVNADSIASTIHGATAKTTPVDADEVGLIDSAAGNVLKRLTWSNIKATLKSYFDSVTTTLTNKTLSSPLFTGTIDGWISAGETWTYASATTFTISGDKTGKYQKEDKLKLTQTTAKYFRILNISYSSPNTTVTVDGFGIYTLANATITSPYYSKMDNPQGFPQKEVLLFSGTPAASITLSETSANFDILDIWYEGNSVGGQTGIPYYYTRFDTAIDDIFVMAVDMGYIDSAYKIRTSGAFITRSGTTLSITGSGVNYSTDTKSDSTVTFSDIKFTPKITRVRGIRW